MPTYILYCKADLEGIESLTLNTTTTTETNDDDDDDGAGGATATAVDCPHMLSFSVCNPTDKEQKREKIVVETHELHDAVVGNHSKHRNETPYHFTLKWDNHSSSGITGNEATLRVLGIDLQSQQQQQNDDNDKTTFQRSQKKIKQTGNSKEMEAALHKVRSMKADDSGTMVPMLAVFCENMEVSTQILINMI